MENLLNVTKMERRITLETGKNKHVRNKGLSLDTETEHGDPLGKHDAVFLKSLISLTASSDSVGGHTSNRSQIIKIKSL